MSVTATPTRQIPDMPLSDSIDSAEASHEQNGRSGLRSFSGTPMTPTGIGANLSGLGARISQGLVPPSSPGSAVSSPSAQILGRRARGPETDHLGWPPATKARHSAFAQDACLEYGVSDAERDIIIQSSQLSTHELVIVMMARQSKNEKEIAEHALRAYLASPEFKVSLSRSLKR